MKVNLAVKVALCLLVAGALTFHKARSLADAQRGQSTAEVHLSDQHCDQAEYDGLLHRS